MGKVIEIQSTYKRAMFGLDEPKIMWVYGKTLRLLEREMGGNPEHLFDTTGTPVLDDEYYEITSAGIRRIE